MEIQLVKPLIESESRLQMATQTSISIVDIAGNLVNQVILFGSTARGTATPQSDIDLCVLLTDQISEFEKAILTRTRIIEGLRERGITVGNGPREIQLACFRERFYFNPDLLPSMLSGVIKAIQREGILLYPRFP